MMVFVNTKTLAFIRITSDLLNIAQAAYINRIIKYLIIISLFATYITSTAYKVHAQKINLNNQIKIKTIDYREIVLFYLIIKII
jgi:hypothetical protein